MPTPLPSVVIDKSRRRLHDVIVPSQKTLPLHGVHPRYLTHRLIALLVLEQGFGADQQLSTHRAPTSLLLDHSSEAWQDTERGLSDWSRVSKYLPFTSQVILLPCCPGVLIQTPLDVAISVFQGTVSYFKTSHCHPRTHLSQFDSLIARPNKNVVSYFDVVLNVLEGNNSASQSGSFGNRLSGREDMLQNLNYPLAQSGCEPFEDEVRIRLANGPTRAVRDIMAENNIVKRE